MESGRHWQKNWGLSEVSIKIESWCYPSHDMSTAKQQVESLLHKLPENCTLEDIQYHLYVLDKVRQGLDDARQRGALSQEEAEKHLSKWLIE